MIEIQAVLFDYGMVLSGPPSPAAWAHMLALTGLDESTFHAAYWAPRHAYDRGRYTGQQHSLPPPAAPQVAGPLAADNDLWTDTNPPMLAWAHQLQQAGMRTGILSNLGDEMTTGVRTKFDWIDGFHHCTWSHAIKLAKPEPAIYHHAAAGLETPIQNILFLDDREENIAGAAEAGMQALHYTTHEAFEQEMATRGLHTLLRPT